MWEPEQQEKVETVIRKSFSCHAATAHVPAAEAPQVQVHVRQLSGEAVRNGLANVMRIAPGIAIQV
jgi:hypothetical protein